MQLSGGDDYELALAISPQHLPQLKRIAGAQVIGAFVAGHGVVRVVDENGAPFYLEQRGYQHFQSESL